MATNVWQCGVCRMTYETETDAKGCEGVHRDYKTFEIINAIYEEWTDSRDAHFNRRVPKRVRIKFSETYGDFATYKLEHYGMRGV